MPKGHPQPPELRKAIRAEWTRQWERKNAKRLKKERAKRYKKTRKKQRAAARNWYWKNRSRALANHASWYAKNKLSRRYRKYVTNHRKKYRFENREWLLKRAKFHQKNRLDAIRVESSRRRALKRSRIHPDHDPKIELQLHQEASRRSKLGEPWAVDHIIPLARFGWHHHANLQLLPRRINGQKGDQVWWFRRPYKSFLDVPSFLWPAWLTKQWKNLPDLHKVA